MSVDMNSCQMSCSTRPQPESCQRYGLLNTEYILRLHACLIFVLSPRTSSPPFETSPQVLKLLVKSHQRHRKTMSSSSRFAGPDIESDLPIGDDDLQEADGSVAAILVGAVRNVIGRVGGGGGGRGATPNAENLPAYTTMIAVVVLFFLWMTGYLPLREAVTLLVLATVAVAIDGLHRLGLLGTDGGTLKVAVYAVATPIFFSVITAALAG